MYLFTSVVLWDVSTCYTFDRRKNLVRVLTQGFAGLALFNASNLKVFDYFCPV